MADNIRALYNQQKLVVKIVLNPCTMQKTKVCVVEDESIIAMGIVQALKELGYETPKAATNYTQALEMIEREKPDIIIIDILLGGMENKEGTQNTLHISHRKL